MKNERLIGIGLLVTFTVSQGLRDVYLSAIFGDLLFFDVVLISFVGATLLFTAWLALLDPGQFLLLVQEWRCWVAVNVTTAGAWLCYFGALHFIEPSAVNSFFSGVAPFAVACLSYFGFRAGNAVRAGKIEGLLHLGIMAALALLFWAVLTGRSGVGSLAPSAAVAGVGLALAAGVLIAVETIYAKRMNNAGISAAGVLSGRFVVIVIVAIIAITLSGQTAIPSMTIEALTSVLLKLTLLVSLPLFLVQKGLAMTSPLTTSVVAAFGPVVVFLLQGVEGRLETTSWVLVATLAYAFFASVSVFARARQAALTV